MLLWRRAQEFQEQMVAVNYFQINFISHQNLLKHDKNSISNIPIIYNAKMALHIFQQLICL